MAEQQSTQAQDSPAPFAARYGFVRPAHGSGRYVAGVAGALGRATRTDPVLWRVVLAVLVCFAGLGVLAYFLGWLLMPEEGDTGSPLESLIGRGYSRTSPAVTGLLAVVVVILLAIVLPRPFYLVLAAVLGLGLILLVNRARTGAAPGAPGAPAADPAGMPGAATAGADPGTAPGADAGAVPPGAYGEPRPAPATPVTPVAPMAPADPAAPGTVGAPAVPGGSAGTTPPPPPGASPVPPGPWSPPAPPWGPAGTAAGGYRPPLAPHGPFAGTSAPPPPPRPRPRRERSSLPGLALLAAVLTLALLGGLEVLRVVDLPMAGYVAAALTVIGGGLLLGAWLGRARILIAFAAVLALTLPAAHALDTWDRPEYTAGDFTWSPETPAELEEEYDLMFGSGVLNLSRLDLSGQDVEVVVRARFSEMRILVPDDVAVEAAVDNRFGDASVLGQSSDGLTPETFSDPGSGDPADGTLRLDLHVRFGDLEVQR